MVAEVLTHVVPVGWTSSPAALALACRVLASLLRLVSRSAWPRWRCAHAPSRRVSHVSRMMRANAAALPPTIAAEMHKQLNQNATPLGVDHAFATL